jgi:RsmE family RNA methyltransferase
MKVHGLSSSEKQKYIQRRSDRLHIFTEEFFQFNNSVYCKISPKDVHYLKNVLRFENGENISVIARSIDALKIHNPSSEIANFFLSSNIRSSSEQKDENFTREDFEAAINKHKNSTSHSNTQPTIIFNAKLCIYNDISLAKVTGIEQDSSYSSTSCTNILYRQCVIALSFALCKGDKNELVCQKATELGCDYILFWQAERSIVKLSAHSSKQSRLLSIAEGASKQSLRSTIPEVLFFKNLSELLSFNRDKFQNNVSILAATLSVDALPLNKSYVQLNQVNLFIGPEGDFSTSEIEMLLQHGGRQISLGPQRLRSETAAITGVAMLQVLYN